MNPQTLLIFFFLGGAGTGATVPDPDLAGATVHRAHLRGLHEALTRDAIPAQLCRDVAGARTREASPANTRRANRDR